MTLYEVGTRLVVKNGARGYRFTVPGEKCTVIMTEFGKKLEWDNYPGAFYIVQDSELDIIQKEDEAMRVGDRVILVADDYNEEILKGSFGTLGEQRSIDVFKVKWDNEEPGNNWIVSLNQVISATKILTGSRVKLVRSGGLLRVKEGDIAFCRRAGDEFGDFEFDNGEVKANIKMDRFKLHYRPQPPVGSKVRLMAKFDIEEYNKMVNVGDFGKVIRQESKTYSVVQYSGCDYPISTRSDNLEVFDE